MFGKKKTPQKKAFSINFEKRLHKAEEIAKTDYNIIKKDIDFAKKEMKKLESPGVLDFFFTYGWAILIIIAGIGGFVWWDYYSVHSEECEFKQGSGLLCENFDITNESLTVEIRNLNNKSITLNQLSFKTCTIVPEQEIPDNDKRTFKIVCNSEHGKLKEKLIATYTIDNFRKHFVAKMSKIVP